MHNKLPSAGRRDQRARACELRHAVADDLRPLGIQLRTGRIDRWRVAVGKRERDRPDCTKALIQRPGATLLQPTELNVFITVWIRRGDRSMSRHSHQNAPLAREGKVKLTDFAERLLHWYEVEARVLPWRVGPAARRIGRRPDPYRVWLSEIMLQQTTIAHATRYFLAFTERWPTVSALAAAEDPDVMAAWAGLGYYARARNLLKCARVVSAAGGTFPDTVEGLRELPGIGPYTAGAVAAIAFGRRASAVDGNVDRVLARQLALEGNWAAQKEEIRAHADALVPADRPGEFAEALMDLGATVCTPRSPDCGRCPVSAGCKARLSGDPVAYPKKPRKAATQQVSGWVLVVFRDGRVGVCRRPERGLLGGMLGLPGSDWDARRSASNPPSGNVRLTGSVAHVFTHFRLDLSVFRQDVGTTGSPSVPGLEWMPVDAARAALPSVFVKALERAMGAG